jgi:hypothetical protein
MVCAAVEAMVAVRASARRLPTVDDWAARRLAWVATWIKSQGQQEPTREDVETAGLEYLPTKIAA